MGALPSRKRVVCTFYIFSPPSFLPQQNDYAVPISPTLQCWDNKQRTSQGLPHSSTKSEGAMEIYTQRNMCVVEEETVNNPFDIGLSQRGFMPHNSPQVVPNVQRTKGATKTTRICPLPPQIKPLLIINGCLTFRGYLDVVQCLVFRCQMFNDVHRFFRGD